MLNLSIRSICGLCVAAGAILLGSCEIQPEDRGPLRTEEVSVPLGTTQRTNMELDMGAGSLTLRGGSTRLVDGTLEYRGEARKPTVKTSLVGDSTAVTIREPDHTSFGDHHQEWNLSVNNGVLLDLAVNSGAGQTDVNLGDANLRSVTVNIGAGQVDLDLRGHLKRDVDVSVSGGVGQATIYLPPDVGIRAEAHGGIGNISVEGLDKHDGYFQNDLFDQAKANIRLKVEGGVGQIRIVAD